MAKPKADLTPAAISKAFKEFANAFLPFEGAHLHVYADGRTDAWSCECHIMADKLISLGTVDVPLDPDDQPEYRANREVVGNSSAFERMMEDAKLRRSFSNIVTEYRKDFEPDRPLKIIGGQHRFLAIKGALEVGVNEYHGVKVYLGLDMEQRLDVQLISNTNIGTSTDLFDRMHETVKGPQLRDWCQTAGLLGEAVDFADKRGRGGPISVQVARSFITNFYLGQGIDSTKFNHIDTTPVLCPSGAYDGDWDALRRERPGLWKGRLEFNLRLW